MGNPLGLKSVLKKPAHEVAGVKLNKAPFIAREISEEERDLLIAGRLPKQERTLPASGGETVRRLSARHHRLAKLLATGHSTEQAAFVAGYQPNSVSSLKSDPSFQRLIAHYERVDNEVFEATRHRLADLADESLAILQDRLETAPEEMKTKELIEIAKLGADRSGHGPTSTVKSEITLDYGDKMAAARRRIDLKRKAEQEGAVIEGKIIDAA